MSRPKTCECCNKGIIEAGAWEICPLCGWEDDEVQNKRPDYPFGANKLSLNDYRKEYKKKLKENPAYIWEDEIIDLHSVENASKDQAIDSSSR